LKRITCLIVAIMFAPRCVAQMVSNNPSTSPKSVEQMKALLTAAYSMNAFGALSAPYHVLATFQTFDSTGVPDGDGTIERFVVAPRRAMTITKFRGKTMTQYVDEGKVEYTDDDFDGTIMLYQVQSFLFDQLIPPSGIVNRELTTTTRQVNDEWVDCASFQFVVNPRDVPPSPKSAFCLSRNTLYLAMRQNEYMSGVYSDVVPFQGRAVSHTISIYRADVLRASIHLEVMDAATPDPLTITPPNETSPASPGPQWLSLSQQESQPAHRIRLKLAKSIDGEKPYRPSVLILISRTGKVKDVEPLDAPSPALMQAAVTAARKLTYAPIIRQGKPVESMATVFFDVQATDH
jgi:hypothetical protein